MRKKTEEPRKETRKKSGRELGFANEWKSETRSREILVPGNKESFLVSLQEKLGIVSLACRKAGISRETFDQWMENDPKFAQAVSLCQESVLDFAEAKMFELINDGDTRLIRFLLETKGKDRGYVKRKEIADVSPLPVILTPEEAGLLGISTHSFSLNETE